MTSLYEESCIIGCGNPVRSWLWPFLYECHLNNGNEEGNVPVDVKHTRTNSMLVTCWTKNTVLCKLLGCSKWISVGCTKLTLFRFLWKSKPQLEEKAQLIHESRFMQDSWLIWNQGALESTQCLCFFSCAMRGGLEKGEEETARKCCNANNAVNLVRRNISNLYILLSAPVHPSLLNILLACVC